MNGSRCITNGDQLFKTARNSSRSGSPGATSKVPVHTEYGWHVLHVGAISPFVPPSFEQLKDSIRETVLTQLGQQRLMKLRDSAKVVTETPAAAVADKPAADADSKPAEKPAN